MPRHFDGTNDSIHCSIGGCNLSTEARSYVVIAKRGVNTAYHTLFTLHTSGGSIVSGIEVGNDGGHSDEIQVWDSTSVTYSSGGTPLTFTVANNWCLLAFTKATGTVTANFYKYVYDTGVMTTATSSGTVTNNTAPGSTGTVRFGEWEGVDDLNGELAIAGCYSVELTQAQLQSMAFSLPAWFAPAQPAGLWLFDQSAITQNVIDLSGNGANQSAITGTTLGIISLPVWGYGDTVLYERSVAAAAPAQDTPELYGRPYGDRGANQQQQLLAF